MIDEGTTSIVCSYLRIWPYTFRLDTRGHTLRRTGWDAMFPAMVKIFCLTTTMINVTCNYSRLVLVLVVLVLVGYVALVL